MSKNLYCSLVVLISVLSVGLMISCGGGSSSDDGDDGGAVSMDCSATPGSGEVVVCGLLDGVTLSVGATRDDANGNVDAVYACSNFGQCEEATLSGEAFEFTLGTEEEYLVFFLDGNEVIGIYSADPNSDLDMLPTPENATEVDLGTVSADDIGTATGTTEAADIFSVLGIDDVIAEVMGLMDNGFLRYSSVDVDGDGVIDFEEGEEYWLRVDFELDTNSTFDAIQTDYNDASETTYTGYMYYFMADPDDDTVDWDSAVINPPETVTGGYDENAQCYQSEEEGSMILNFYCGGSATNPATPPTGTYTITADLLASGTKTYTFNNVETQTIDANLVGVYVPTVKLTMSDGEVSLVEWQWYKRTETAWEAVTDDDEIAAVISEASYEIGEAGWAGEDVLMSVEITAIGTSTPDEQGFTPGSFRYSYADVAGYNYGVEWH